MRGLVGIALAVGVACGSTPPAKEVLPKVQSRHNRYLADEEAKAQLFFNKQLEFIHELVIEQQLRYIKALIDAKTAATPVAFQGTGGVEQWRWFVALYSWPVDDMLRIMSCEDYTGNPNRIGGPDYDGLYDYGLFQIHGDPAALDPYYNVQRAYEKYQASGFKPWLGSARCHGLY